LVDTVIRHLTGMKLAPVLIAVSGLGLVLTSPALGGAAHRAAATRVSVTFTNSRFAVSRSGVPAGAVTFVATNNGHGPHILAITGPGVKGARTPTIGVGKSATLTVTLGTGAYLLADPLTHTLYVRWLVVSPAANVTSTGNGSVVTPITVTTGMNCD
jgi:hypothetical protein